MGQSPTPQLAMDFPDALKQVIAGKKVTKLEWKNQNEYILLREGMLKIQFASGALMTLLVSEADLLGKDWVVVLEN